MKRKYAIPLLVVVAIGLAALWSNVGPPVKSQEDPANESRVRIAQLNSAAQAARNGDEASLGQLADLVVAQFAPPEAAAFLSGVKGRMVAAEAAYQETGRGGISERKAVEAVNWLARQVDAPGYQGASISQVRFLRMKLKGVFPAFIGASGGKGGKSLGINPEMSPMEAAGITMLLAYQKMSNEEFQVSADQWLANRYKQSTATWKAYRKGARPPAEQEAKLTVKVEAPGVKQLREAIAHTASTFGPDYLTGLADSSLDVLGIRR